MLTSRNRRKEYKNSIPPTCPFYWEKYNWTLGPGKPHLPYLRAKLNIQYPVLGDFFQVPVNNNSISFSSVTKSGQKKLQPLHGISLNTHTTFFSQVELHESRDCVFFQHLVLVPCKEWNSTHVCWPDYPLCVSWFPTETLTHLELRFTRLLVSNLCAWDSDCQSWKWWHSPQLLSRVTT